MAAPYVRNLWYMAAWDHEVPEDGMLARTFLDRKWLIHRLAYRRANHCNLHVRGYKEEGTTTTPFDMVVRNDLDRFHLAMDAIERVPKLQRIGYHHKQDHAKPKPLRYNVLSQLKLNRPYNQAYLLKRK